MRKRVLGNFVSAVVGMSLGPGRFLGDGNARFWGFQIYYISIKPSVSRWGELGEVPKRTC